MPEGHGVFEWFEWAPSCVQYRVVGGHPAAADGISGSEQAMHRRPPGAVCQLPRMRMLLHLLGPRWSVRDATAVPAVPAAQP